MRDVGEGRRNEGSFEERGKVVVEGAGERGRSAALGEIVGAVDYFCLWNNNNNY